MDVSSAYMGKVNNSRQPSLNECQIPNRKESRRSSLSGPQTTTNNNESRRVSVCGSQTTTSNSESPMPSLNEHPAINESESRLPSLNEQQTINHCTSSPKPVMVDRASSPHQIISKSESPLP